MAEPIEGASQWELEAPDIATKSKGRFADVCHEDDGICVSTHESDVFIPDAVLAALGYLRQPAGKGEG